MTMSRREFLAAANATALLFVLESCSLGPIGRSASTPSPLGGGSPYEVALKLLREALKASPDHLAQRAADAVAARDASRIVELVRSSVAVVPPLVPGDDASTSRRWGTRATLRGGLGTLRDRAEALAALLTEAGFKAQVEVAHRPSSLGADSIYRARPLKFVPDANRIDQAKAAIKKGSFPTVATPGAFDPGPDAAAAILAALPPALQVASTRGDLLPTNVPVVSFQDGGKTRYALAIGDVGIVDSAPAGLTPRSADAMRNIAVSVSAVSNPPLGTATPRGKVLELVSASWPADQVVGRQIALTFQPPQGAKAVLDSGLGALPIRAPVLHVQGTQDLVAIGNLITVHGDVLGPANASTTPGSIQALAEADRAAKAARVTGVKVTANPAAFPDVELAVSLLDAGGASVDGLDAPAFTIKEQGAGVDAFALYSNAAVQARPRVLVVYDAYVDFAPKLFGSAAAKAAFESTLAQTLVDQAAKTPFDVQVVPMGRDPNPSGWGAPVAATLTAQFAAAFEAADDPWETAGGAALDQNISALVCVSDFDALDTDPAKLPTWKRRLLAAGTPVFAIPVGTVNSAVTDAIVALTNGRRLSATDLSPLPGLLAGTAAKWVNNSYRIRYRAHTDGPSQRNVTIGVAKASGAATYTVPTSPVPQPAFAGLYVTMTFGPLTATRRIAGVELSSRGVPLGALDDPAVVAETAAAIDGVTTIAIEGGSPTVAAAMDDVVSSLLSIAPLQALGASPTNDQFVAAAKNVVRTPLALPSLLRPAPVDAGCVEGLRVAILQGRSRSSTTMEEHADLAVGLNEIVPLAADRHTAFKAALETSVLKSAAEAATYADSAYRRLAGRASTAIQAGDSPAFGRWLQTVPEARKEAWANILRVYEDSHLVVPAAGAADGAWVIDPRTGVAKAVLLDSTGGAIGREGNCHIDAFDAEAIEIAILALACSGSGEQWPFFCNGINTAASGMCVIAIFKGKADLGTPAGAIQPWLGLGEAGLGWLDAAIGAYLLLITLSAAGCI